MRISIDEDVVNHSGMNIPLFLTALCVKSGVNLQQNLLDLLSTENVVIRNGILYVSPKMNTTIDRILLDSDKVVPSTDELKDFAKELMLLVPQGRMGDTPYFYKCNAAEVSLSLQRFYKVYNIECTREEIKDAIKTYVENFDGDYTYMKLLKNFIYQVDRFTGDISSELASYIEAMRDDKKNS